MVHKMCVQRGHKAPTDSSVHERDEDIVCYGYARERESTHRDHKIVELAPPGYPLVGLGHRLVSMVTRATRVTSRPALSTWALTRDKAITAMIMRTGAVLIKPDVILAQVVRGTRTSQGVRVELAVPDQLSRLHNRRNWHLGTWNRN